MSFFTNHNPNNSFEVNSISVSVVLLFSFGDILVTLLCNLTGCSAANRFRFKPQFQSQIEPYGLYFLGQSGSDSLSSTIFVLVWCIVLKFCLVAMEVACRDYRGMRHFCDNVIGYVVV